MTVQARYTPETDYAILEEQGRTQSVARRTPVNAASGAGVESLNNKTGAVALVQGNAISVSSPAAQQIAVALIKGITVAKLAYASPLTSSNPPTQAEVNAVGVRQKDIADKLDAVITLLETANFIT